LLVQAIGNSHLSSLAFCELNRTDRRRRRKRTLFSLAIWETQKRMKISDFRFQHNYNQRRDYTDVIVLSKHKYNSLFRRGRVVHVTIMLQLGDCCTRSAPSCIHCIYWRILGSNQALTITEHPEHQLCNVG
jgi:hypothetical protein